METRRPLEGKRVAVLVESEFIPKEIAAYLERFGEYGASVDLVSRLWGREKQTFVSDVTEAGREPETLDVHLDFNDVRAEDYAVVIASANYTSVRLRQFDPPQGPDGEGAPIAPEMTRRAPAVTFFSRAMRNSNIVKGALCHSLWLLTPVPELLAGRHVICHEVVLADVFNAGAIYTPSSNDGGETTPAPGIVVDGDLVTGRSGDDVLSFIDAIVGQVARLKEERPQPHEQPKSGQTSEQPKRVLVVLSERGYWGEELVGPLEKLDEAGYQVDFVTPTGKRPVALPVSLDADYVDPPLNRPVTTEEMAAKARALDQSDRLTEPRDLSSWFPERPYWSHPNLIRAMEAYNRSLAAAERELDHYDALLIVGGSGAIVDLSNNQRLHDLILGFYRADKPIAAECYGVTCLAFARDIEDRKSIISGRHVTGHCLEYDYKDGTGFVGTDFNMGPPPYPLEYILRDATSPGGQYHGNVGEERSVIVDGKILTARSTPDSQLMGEKLVEVLENGLERYGW